MEKLGLNTIRSKFLEFYQSKQHYRLNSFPLIPKDDKSLLIINSGMAPMKAYFAGIKEPPSKRVTTCQKCVRTLDIENVGFTSRHGTFFEMLGSFSFGDYFKKESLTWGWEFMTEVMKMPVDKLWATVYLDDDEAYDIWKNEIGMPEERIVRLGKDDNFWEIGSGPCGPCSEIYFDRGEKYGCGKPDCKPGCDCDRYVEFWNHVFTQFDNDGQGNYSDLVQKNIDTGMGLERLACIMQDVDSIFDVDTIAKVLHTAEEMAGVSYESGDQQVDVSLRIITDHVRSATFMIGDKIMPGNEGRGYVLRRLIRRAARHGRKIGMKDAFLKDLVDVVVDTCSEAYPELETQRTFIKKIVAGEEERFMRTLDQGEQMMEDYAADLKAKGESVLPGELAFKLHDTYGFPIDITEEVMEEKGFTVDREGFEAAMARQKEMGRADFHKEDVAWDKEDMSHIFTGETLFTGYARIEDEANVLTIFRDSGELDFIGEGEEGRVILDRTPFYATGGGQECDTGYLYTESGKLRVKDVEKNQKTYVHTVVAEEGSLNTGDKVRCVVDKIHRNNSARNHTATHLLQKALQETLGDHVEQSGSQVTAQGLRFDFTHFEAMTKKQIREVEERVNEKIDEFMTVETKEMAYDEAMAEGAMGLFEDKYGDKVRVVNAGGWSKELCGGIHVANTGQIGAFHIVSEGGVAAGVRRIEAVTGHRLREMLVDELALVQETAESLKTTAGLLPEKVRSMTAENKALKKEIEEYKKEMVAGATGDLLADAQEINGVKLVAKAFDDYSVDDLRGISDELKASGESLCLVLASKTAEKVTFIVSLTEDVVSRGYHAGKMIKEIAKAAGGGGGGKADMAQAGGKDPSKTEEALAIAAQLLAQ
ncbi:MAG: alanine--tRNA ligase [Clostridiales bacterium]|nr:alanine--tRNA ligase [Clostridiales bacterium]